MAERKDFTHVKGATFDEEFATVTSGIKNNSCSPSMLLMTSPNGREYLSLNGDHVQFKADLTAGIETTTFNIQILANVLANIPAYRYWYVLYMNCLSKKHAVCEGYLTLEEGAVDPCDIPLADSIDTSMVVGDPPVITDINEELRAVYARRDPLYFSVVGGNPIADIQVEMPWGGTYVVWAKVRGNYVKDPGFRHGVTEYRVGIVRYGQAWRWRLPWSRYDEYQGGELESGAGYIEEEGQFIITITATDDCGQSTSESFTIDIEL